MYVRRKGVENELRIFQKLKIIQKAFSLTPFKKTAVAQET